MEIEFSRKQYEALTLLSEPEVNFILYGGAIRGAKTAWIVLVFAFLAVYYPNSRWVIMRSDGPKITNNLLPTVNYFYSKPEIARFIVGSNKSTHTWTFFNGSTVQLMAESYTTDKELTRFTGLEANGFGLDEMTEFQEKTFKKCFERAGSWLNAGKGPNGKKPRPIVLGSANPFNGWVKDNIWKPWRDKTAAFKKSWRYIQARIYDNPWIEDGYLDNLRNNMTKEDYDRFVGGDWDFVESFGHEWLYNFSYTSHVRKTEYLPHLASYLSFDFNVWPYMTCVAFQIEKIIIQTSAGDSDGWRIRFYKEYCLASPHNNTQDVCEAWIKDYRKGTDRTPVYYCGDKSGENKIPGFSDAKAFNDVRNTLAPYLHNSSDQVFKKMFFNVRVRKMLNDMLGSRLPVEVWVDEKNCPNLIKDCMRSVDDPKTGGFIKEQATHPELKVKYEANGHCLDAMKYGFLSAFSETYINGYHNNKLFLN